MIGETASENLGLLLLAQGTISLAAGLAASHLLRRRAARAHQALLTAMAIAVLLPALHLLVHQLELGVLPPKQPPAPEQAVEPDASMSSELIDLFTSQGEPSPAASGIAEPAAPLVMHGTATVSMPWGTIFLLCWASAATLLSARLALRFLLALNVVRMSKPLEELPLRRAVEAAQGTLGIERAIRIRHSERVRSPVIWCWTRRPVLLIHESQRREDLTNWVGILRHELAHWKRRDHLSGLFAELLVALVPWHMLLWWARARLLQLSEQACDDWAVAGGQPAVDYAESLLDLSAEGQLTLLPAVVGKEKAMKERIRRIVKDGCGDPRIGTRWALLAGSVATLLAVGAAFAQRPPAERPAREPAERGELRQHREQEDLALAGRRNVLERLLEQLTRQARETEAALSERGKEMGEQAIVLRAELGALRDHIQTVERQLRGLEQPQIPGRRAEEPGERRTPTVPRERPARDADVDRLVAELRNEREESARRAREIGLELSELQRQGRDEEARNLQRQLREVQENLGRIEREMVNVERRRQEATPLPEPGPSETEVRELIRRRLELAAEMERAETSLRLREGRGEGRTDASDELRERMRGMREETNRIDEQMRGLEADRSRRSRNVRTDRRDSGEMVTKIFRLQHANPEELMAILRPLISPRGGAASNESTSSIVVSDAPDNLARIEAIVRELDVPGNNGGRERSERARGVDKDVEELRGQVQEMRMQMEQMRAMLQTLIEREQQRDAERSDRR